ncbi:InlB B-repeat-containing protein [Culicoidibacter larvae]|uniref:Uncharacterized protein n=1 Tax=Culicoidibacter larvae TaxID=2579976 RepID=A0A5R8QAJ9_9FIRM|nr:InlB B-repeat-containing protein [Culicoidibacter larvae]TLG72679.1 hypothetical protein FEZ08_08170 [Culicoidibacter larvae]
MSKNIFKRFFAVAIALLVLSAQINIPVSAFTGENDTITEADANQDESAANANEQEATTDDTEVAGENAVEAVEVGNGAAATRSLLRAEVKPFATFDGQDLSTADNSVTYQNYTSSISSQTLEISAPITDSPTITSHQLVIRIENGLAIESGPGLKSNGAYNGNTVKWIFDASSPTLPDDLQGKIIGATWTPDPIIKGFYQPASGTLTYDIAPGTTAINLSLAIKSDIGFNLTDSQISYTNPITVQKLENGSVVTEEKLENYTISGLYRPVIYSHGSTQSMYVKPGETVAINNFLDQAGASVPLNQYKDVLYEEITFTWKIDKNAGLQGIKPNGKYSTSNMIVAVDRTSDSQYDLVTMTLDKAPVGNQYFSFQFQPPADAADGTYQLLLVDSKTKLYGHSEYINYPNFALYPTATAAWPTIIVSSSTASNVALAGISGNTNFAYNPLQDSEDIVPLGGFALTNLTPNDSAAQNIQMKFDDASYGVKAVRIAFGAKATNIVITTNKGQTFTINELTGTYNSTRRIRLANIVLANLGTITDDEYIADITYTADTIPAGTNAPDSMNGSVGPLTDYYALVLEYFGHMISRPATNKFTATASMVDSDKSFTDASAKHATNTMTVVDAKKITFSTTESFSSTVKSSGTIVPMSIRFNKNSYIYTYDSAGVVTGFEIYLREGEYLIVDQSSIKVTWGNEVYTVDSAEMTVTPTTDNTGNRVYRLTLPEVKLGSFNSTLNYYPAIQVDYSVKIKPTAPTTSIPSKDIAQILPMNGMSVVAVGGNGGNNQYNNANIFNVDGSGNTIKAVGTPSSTTTLKIQAQKSFTVTSAANLNDGPWVSYDYMTQKEIINLNPEGNAKYQLTVTNNSGQTIDGYTALVPIPKAGEATNLMPDNPADFNSGIHLQKTPFEWTVSLLEELNTDVNALNYQILYATSYETNKDSSEFVSWDAIADKNDIRMVKITTTDSIVDGTNDVVEFPLALTDPNPEANAGKTNIYSARIHRVIDGSAGYNPSEPVAIRLKTGIVTGTVFNDLNRNGLQDAGESGRNGVTVRVYEAGTSNLLDTVVSHEKNGVDGVYEFFGLDKNQNVDIVFTNPNTDDSTRFSPVTSGGSTPTETSDHKSAKTASITPSSASSIVVNAGIITPTTVTMNAQGGSTAETTIKRYPGEQIMTEPEVIREGYTYNGWFTATSGGSKVAFPYTVGAADDTLYAQYTVNQYTLTFDIASNGGEGVAPTTQTINYGNTASTPATPVKTGYTFTGWYDAATGGNQWNFSTNTMPATNVTLYAQFTINNYTLTFNNDGVETTSSVTYGDTITEPAAPVKTGYTFNGWYDAATGGNQWNFTIGTMPANNLTLFAQYTVNQYTLSFDIASNGGEGSKPAAQTINYNSTATAPADAVKTGYTFTGWYDAVTGGNKWDFATTTMPAANTILYAQFIINSVG